ncbi:choice-of-anchor G family protein, partial [Galactobacter valiniphilus]|uniref:choice-of-anchor G family protein n=1 Tax=Galactobacter valiniphilus TaxID=2676122 RepID=UPI0037351CD5
MATLGTAPAYASASDQAEAEGNLISGSVAGLNTDVLADLERAYSGNVSSPTTDSSPLDLTALSLINLDLGGGLQVPLFGDSGIIAVGAAGQYAKTGKNPNTAYGSSGLVGEDGAIAVDGDTDPANSAYVDLTKLLAAAGLDDATGQLVSKLRVELGAIAASATQNGDDAATGAYKIADGKLILESPAVAALAGTLNTALGSALGDVQTALNGLVGTNGALNTALSGVTGTLNGILVDFVGSLPGVSALVSVQNTVLQASLDTSSLPGILDGVLGQPITSPDGLVSIDLSEGTVTVNLAKAVAGSNGSDLNGLPANTEVLSSATVNAILDGVQAAVGGLTDKVIDLVTDAVNGLELKVNVSAGLSALGGVVGGDIKLQINGTVGGFLGVDGASKPTLTATGSTLTVLFIPIPIGTIVNALTTPVLDLVQTTVATALGSVVTGDNSIIHTAFDGVLQPIVTTLQPVFDVLTKVASIKVNVQENPGNFETSTAVDAGSFTERALQVTLLPTLGTPLAQVNLASATVRSTAEAVGWETSLTADPTEVAPGATSTLTGTGFEPGETVTFTVADAPVGTGIANDESEVTFVYTVPADAQDGDTITVTATGATSNTPADATLTVQADGGSEAGATSAATADVNANAAASAAASAQATADKAAAA